MIVLSWLYVSYGRLAAGKCISFHSETGHFGNHHGGAVKLGAAAIRNFPAGRNSRRLVWRP